MAIFWTCAVYIREAQMFFGDAIDTLMFFVIHVMPLDQMQLATRPGLMPDAAKLSDNQIPETWHSIASHRSPAPLITGLLNNNRHCTIRISNSNGHAAQLCADGEVEACITTETARREYGLATVHVFGSPPMVFFGGITSQGADLIRKVMAQRRLQPPRQ